MTGSSKVAHGLNWSACMKTMAYSECRAKFAQVLDIVVDDCEEVVITRAGKEPAVIVSLAEYEALKETAYLMRNPENARRIDEAIAELAAGGGQAHERIDP